MKTDFEIRFLHTEPCSVCKGNFSEYRSRAWCKGCRSLRDKRLGRKQEPEPEDGMDESEERSVEA